MTNPVLEQSEIVRQPAMSHAGRSWLQHAPNSGFNSRDGSQLLQRLADNMLSVCLGLAGATILILAVLGVTFL